MAPKKKAKHKVNPAQSAKEHEVLTLNMRPADYRNLRDLQLVPDKFTVGEDLYQKACRFCRWQCTQQEVMDVLGIGPKLMTKMLRERGWTSWLDFYRFYSAGGKASLRRAQYMAATIDRNPTMLVWMGKQHLNQTDKREQRIVTEERVSIDASKLSDAELDAILDAASLIEGDFEEIEE